MGDPTIRSAPPPIPTRSVSSTPPPPPPTSTQTSNPLSRPMSPEVRNLVQSVGGPRPQSSTPESHPVPPPPEVRDRLQNLHDQHGLSDVSRQMTQMLNRAERILNQPEPQKGFWAKVKTALIGGSERGNEARALAKNLREMATRLPENDPGRESLLKKAEKLDSWGKWEGRVEQGGLVQKLPQVGGSITNLVASGASETSKTSLQLAGAVVGSVASGAQIIMEAAEMRQNIRKYSDSSVRKARAEVLVQASNMNADQLQGKIGELQKGIDDIQAQLRGDKKIGWFTSRSSLEKKLAVMQAQKEVLTEALGNVQAGKPAVSKEGLAVAQQIVDSSFTKFKLARIAKNVIGIAAGVIGVAVALGALATPVGWIAAGVSVAALAGVFIYNKYQSSKREGAIQEASSQLRQLNKQVPQNLEEAKQLQTQKTEAAINLMRVSPEHGAQAIIDGVAQGNPEMKYILHSVLSISESDYNTIMSQPHGDKVLAQMIKRGMPLQPKL